jgi:hypothetical protein
MPDERISPFVPGARIALYDIHFGWREAFVAKVYKNGNFTIDGDKSNHQYRPSSSRSFVPANAIQG